MRTKKELEKRAKAFFNAVYGDLHLLPSADLRQLQKACEKLTTTNCWWATYELGPILKAAIEHQMKFRISMSKAKKRSGKGKAGVQP